MEFATCSISFPQGTPEREEPDPCKITSHKLLLACHFKNGLQEQPSYFQNSESLLLQNYSPLKLAASIHHRPRPPKKYSRSQSCYLET